MENSLIPVEHICMYHKVEVKFVKSLEDFGLIQTKIVKKAVFLDIDELPKLERYIRLHQELDINLEGLHAVSHLLDQLQQMQTEMGKLKNEINYYRHI